jgi:hypothetical protein
LFYSPELIVQSQLLLVILRRLPDGNVTLQD